MNLYILLNVSNRGKSILPLFIFKVLESQMNYFIDQTVHNWVEGHLAKNKNSIKFYHLDLIGQLWLSVISNTFIYTYDFKYFSL